MAPCNVLTSDGGVSGELDAAHADHPPAAAETLRPRLPPRETARDWYAFYSPVFATALAPSGELIGKKPPAHPQPPMTLSTFAATYANDYYGPATVRVTTKGLQLVLGPMHRTYLLRHWNGNVFAFTPVGENGTDVTAVTFEPVSGGTGTDMTIEYLNTNGLGTFTRRTP